MLLALKIDVDTCAAACDHVPHLVELLKRKQADATFFFNMGPDRSGVAGGKLFQVGETRAQQKQNWRQAKPHGAAGFYGTILPAPLMVKRAAAAMQAVAQAGFDTGVRGWDWVRWVKQSDEAKAAWLQAELVSARAAYEQVFNKPAHAIALPQWLAPRTALRLQQRLEFEYASDTRGTHPFLPVVAGEPVRVPQLPVTLPTLAELSSGMKGIDTSVENLLNQTGSTKRALHVFNIQAQADSGKRLPQLEQLFAGWQEQGYQLVSMQTLFASLDVTKLPWHTVEYRRDPCYAAPLACQGKAFPA